MYHFDYIQSINTRISAISLPNWTCNDTDYIEFDFSRFVTLQSLSIGDDSFSYVQTFKIDGLNRLKSIKIGKNSFTQVKGGPNASYHFDCKSFHILNCQSLESIQIGHYSFLDFAGEFELKNLPQLQSIQIGTVGSDSSNFCYSSFRIGGIELIYGLFND